MPFGSSGGGYPKGMSGALGSVYFTILVLVAAVVLTGVGVVWIVPLVFIMIAATMFNPIMRMFRESRLSGPGPQGVPTTKDASYNPQVDPSDHPTN